MQTLWSVPGPELIMSGSSSCQLMTLENKNYISSTGALRGLINICGQGLELKAEAFRAQVIMTALSEQTSAPSNASLLHRGAGSRKHLRYGTEVRPRYQWWKESISTVVINREDESKRLYFMWSNTTVWLSPVTEAIHQIFKRTERKRNPSCIYEWNY